MIAPHTHILVIEDDPILAASLRASLEREGYLATLRSTGQEGVDYVREHGPHLVLLDVRLPDLSGFDVCRQMRQYNLCQPIIMLTARRDEMDKVLGLEMGADDYVTKPFSLRELLSRIRAQLRRAYGDLSNASADQLYVRDLVIDRGRGTVKRGSEILNLTPTEFRLLVYLAQNTGQALSRAQIVDAVWSYDADIDGEQAVKVHIRRLREKVELDPSAPTLVLTVPGIGYRLAN